MEKSEGRSLAETPTWAVSTVVTVLVVLVFIFHGWMKKFEKWLDKTKRKPLLSALDKIKEELMLFGLLSLLMGHWIVFFAKICVKSSALSRRFYPCAPQSNLREPKIMNHIVLSVSDQFNFSHSRELHKHAHRKFCPEGLESFASYESLEQLHRFLFVLGITHVTYSFAAIALAVIKIHSWRTWENQAMSMAIQESQYAETFLGTEEGSVNRMGMKRLPTFVFHHTSHPWSRHRVLVWLLCFSRQFWSSISQADYRALRLGFITTHQLPLTYDFHKYMLRSMEEEFRDIVGISVPLWIFGISCILLGFHGTNIYFWISFLPALLILLVGTKLHRIVVKLAVEITDSEARTDLYQFNLRDELFWFGNPRLLLRLIQFISFQNAFEMATYIWSLWEVRGPSCFTENRSFVVIRLTFGLVSQFWCSFITFPLYVIITQMGSRFKKSIISENVRRSLHGWRTKVRSRRQGPFFPLITSTSTTSLDSMADEVEKVDDVASSSNTECSKRCNSPIPRDFDRHASTDECETSEIPHPEEKIQFPHYDVHYDIYDGHEGTEDVIDSSCLLRQRAQPYDP